MKDDRNVVVRDGRAKMTDPFWMWRDFDDIFNSFRRDMDRMLWEPTFGFGVSPGRRLVRREFTHPMDL
ncbi:MAG: hypothetical protein ACMUFK_03190, partial [Thermoplasmatota archaeon]